MKKTLLGVLLFISIVTFGQNPNKYVYYFQEADSAFDAQLRSGYIEKFKKPKHNPYIIKFNSIDSLNLRINEKEITETIK